VRDERAQGGRVHPRINRQQGRSGLGLEAQADRIAAFAAAEGMTIIATMTEVETGKRSNALERRPVLADAIAAARKHKATILVAKLDRLSRDVHFISGLMATKVPFIVAELGADVDPFIIYIYAAAAQKDRTLISQRTRDALQQAKRRGVKLGPKTPEALAHAQARGREALQANADENATRLASTIAALRNTGVWSYSATARELNALGVKPIRGTAWWPVTARALVQRIDRIAAEAEAASLQEAA
jgi:DNA invertase Pin-like site-specific DNA recombinase